MSASTTVQPDLTAWRAVVAAAVTAASVHNTQPWLFRIVEGALEVHADPERRLGVLDPDGRDLALSLGAAAGTAEVVLEGTGWSAQVEPVVEVDRPLLHAVVRVLGRRTPARDSIDLIGAVSRRRTQRAALTGVPLRPATMEMLRREAHHGGGWMTRLDPGPAAELANACTCLDDRLQADPQAEREQSRWMHHDPLRTDGVPSRSVPPQRQHSLRPAQARHRFRTAGTLLTPDLAGATPEVLLLGGFGDDRAAWVRAGVALTRVWLRLTAFGLQVAPDSHLAEFPELRPLLAAATPRGGVPLVVLRAGRGPTAAPTGRRDVDEVLLP